MSDFNTPGVCAKCGKGIDVTTPFVILLDGSVVHQEGFCS